MGIGFLKENKIDLSTKKETKQKTNQNVIKRKVVVVKKLQADI